MIDDGGVRPYLPYLPYLPKVCTLSIGLVRAEAGGYSRDNATELNDYLYSDKSSSYSART